MKIGAQLYTLREHTKTRDDFARTLDQVAAMGYEGVQLSAVGCMNGEAPEVSAEDARRLLDERGLICAATHRGFEALEEKKEEELSFHQALGCSFTAIGSAPGWAMKAGEGAREFLSRYLPIVDWFKERGLDVGYHNHAWEFQRGEGGRFFDVLVEHGPQLMIEMDTYWVHYGGMEVVPQIERLSGRLPVVHLKDLSPFGWTVNYAPIGEGNLDWPRILPALELAGTEWLLVELDECPRDPFDCLKVSAEYLKSSLA